MKNYQDIAPAEAAQRLDEFRIVDVREPREWKGDLGHIPGAEFLPLGEVGSLNRLQDDPRPLLLICRSGKRSEKACELLYELKFQSPHNLAGGMLEWDRLGLAAETRS